MSDKRREISKTRPPTQRDVARHANVSQSAVSRVFIGSGYVADDVRARILEAAAALAYKPDEFARALVKGTANIVAILIADVDNPFYPHVVRLLTERLRRLGSEVLVFSAPPGSEVDDLVPLVLRHRIAGAIVANASSSSNAAAMLKEAGVRTVQFNRYSERGTADIVVCDNHKGGENAAVALIAAGCRRLAYVGGTSGASTNRDRWLGFQVAAQAAGVSIQRHLDGAFTYEWGRRAVKGFGHDIETIDGIFCGDDVTAFGVIDGLRHDLGRRVPEEVSVVGFDDVPQAAWAAYDLTTIRQPVEHMIEATLLLLDKPEGIFTQRIILPGYLVARGTVRLGSRD